MCWRRVSLVFIIDLLPASIHTARLFNFGSAFFPTGENISPVLTISQPKGMRELTTHIFNTRIDPQTRRHRVAGFHKRDHIKVRWMHINTLGDVLFKHNSCIWTVVFLIYSKWDPGCQDTVAGGLRLESEKENIYISYVKVRTLCCYCALLGCVF